MSTEAPKAPFAIKSAKGKLFQELGRPSANFFSDDFVQEKFETIKIKGNSPKDGFWEYKGSTKLDCTKSACKSNFEDEVRVFFPLNDRFSFWFGSRKKDPQLKFHVDFGKFKVGNYDINLFSNAKASSDFKKVQFRIGGNYFSSNLEINSRLETCPKNFLCLTDRLLYTKNNFVGGFIGTLCLKTFNLCRYDFLLGYEKKNQFEVFFKHLTDPVGCTGTAPCEAKKGAGCCGLACGKFNLAFKYFKGKNTFAAEVDCAAKDLCCKTECCTEKKCCPCKCKVGVQSQINDKLTVKAKINCGLEFANSWKYKVNDKLTVTGSFEVPIKDFISQKPKADDPKVFPIFPVGVQFDLNI